MRIAPLFAASFLLIAPALADSVAPIASAASRYLSALQKDEVIDGLKSLRTDLKAASVALHARNSEMEAAISSMEHRPPSEARIFATAEGVAAVVAAAKKVNGLTVSVPTSPLTQDASFAREMSAVLDMPTCTAKGSDVALTAKDLFEASDDVATVWSAGNDLTVTSLALKHVRTASRKFRLAIERYDDWIAAVNARADAWEKQISTP